MVILLLGLLFLVFLVYGVFLIVGMKNEDPAQWPEVVIPGEGARCRIHPSWTILPPDPARPALLCIEAGVPRGHLTVECIGPACSPDRTTPPVAAKLAPEPGGPVASRLSSVVGGSGLALDSPSIELFRTECGEGARIASAGSQPDGERGFFEFHLVESSGGGILFSYRCPVLSGSIDGLTLTRIVSTIASLPAQTRAPAATFPETGAGSPK